ncbi:MAG: polysaccharide deacetylase family protein [Planctomycetota bacterium]|nr:MAG: polysaccharide deacetylase family protein [Planctomycetota bacterium]
MTKFTVVTIVFLLILAFVMVFSTGAPGLVLAASICLAYLIVLGIGVSFIKLNFFTKAFSRGNPSEKTVALTYDDGPDPENTPRLLDELSKLQVKASFFCIGENVEKHAGLITQMADEGHLVCNHTYRHGRWTNFLTPGKLAAEISRTAESIEKITGERPAFYRPPMGLTNPRTAKAAKTTGSAVVGWDVRGLDRKATSPGKTIKRITGKARNGSIIALHDSGVDGKVMIAVLREIVDNLRKRGFTFVRIDELYSQREA